VASKSARPCCFDSVVRIRPGFAWDHPNQFAEHSCERLLPASPVNRAASSAVNKGLTSARKSGRSSFPSVVGSILGIMPGGGPVIAQFAAYGVDEKFSKYRDEMGKGAIKGVAGQAAADEAASRTSFIPLMSLGIPENAVMALMMAAFLINGVQPGPSMITKHPELFWGWSQACGSATASCCCSTYRSSASGYPYSGSSTVRCFQRFCSAASALTASTAI
jgi:hypothetical protein